MIRKASFSDLAAIYKIVKEATVRLNNEGNQQWTSQYPTKKILRKDVTNGHLYVKVVDEEVLGLIVLNFSQPEQYAELPWKSAERSLVIHRMAVKNSALGNGVGKELVQFAGQHARENLNVAGIRTDTYSLNSSAQQLFASEGYEKVGNVQLRESLGDFYCYEMIIPDVTPVVTTRKRGRRPKSQMS